MTDISVHARGHKPLSPALPGSPHPASYHPQAAFDSFVRSYSELINAIGEDRAHRLIRDHIDPDPRQAFLQSVDRLRDASDRASTRTFLLQAWQALR